MSLDMFLPQGVGGGGAGSPGNILRTSAKSHHHHHHRPRTTPTSTPTSILASSSSSLISPQKLVKSISMLSQWGDVDVEELTVFGRPWQYRGEGNANIVIALQDDLRVLRLSKASLESQQWEELEEDKSLGDESRRRVEREVAFANSVFIPLLGVEYVGHVQAVHLTPQHIQQLNAALRPLRPAYRLHKELRIPFATAHRDFARIHPYPSTRTDYCVEIKPKQGWWPKHLKHAKCTYCLNQFLKLERSKITSRTEYCPLDLFSGIPDRMIQAILALVSNPQNNLRLFRDGLLVYGENVGGMSTLSEILSEWIQLEATVKNGIVQQESHPSPSPGLLSNFVFLLCTALLKPKRTPGPFSPVSREFDKLKSSIGQSLLRFQLLQEQQQQQNLPANTSASGAFQQKEVHGGGAAACDADSLPLPEGSILSRILDIQKMADVPGGVESLYKLHSRICPVHSNSSSGGSSPSAVGGVIQNLGDVTKQKKKGRVPSLSSSSSSSSSSSNDEVFELDLDSNSSSSSNGRGTSNGNSSIRIHTSYHHMNKNDNDNDNIQSAAADTSSEDDASCSSPQVKMMRHLEEEDQQVGGGESSSGGDGCGGDGPEGSETSGLSSLSQDEEEEEEEEEATLREDCLKCPGPHCLSMERWLDELGADKLAKTLSNEELSDMESYLIAATAKDCSIMITFSPISGERARERTLSEAEADSISALYSPTSPSISNYEESDLILQDLEGTFHRVRIGVADLDPKPVSCIVKHFLRDMDMLADFAAYNQKLQRDNH